MKVNAHFLTATKALSEDEINYWRDQARDNFSIDERPPDWARYERPVYARGLDSKRSWNFIDKQIADQRMAENRLAALSCRVPFRLVPLDSFDPRVARTERILKKLFG